MEFRAAQRAERDEVLALLALWHNDAEFFARYNRNDPLFRDELCLVARDGGRLVSTVQIFDRAINLDGHRVPMGGIGSVYTLDEYRHKGVASRLMRLAVETMEREGFEVSLLFAERLTFYNQFGWREVNRQFSVLGTPAAIRADDRDRFVIEVFDEPRDLPRVAEIHRRYSGTINVTALRALPAWRANLKFAGNQPGHPGEDSEEYFIVCRAAGEILAYARVAGFHGVAMVMEYGYADGDTPMNAILALFKYMGETAAGTEVSASLRGDHRRARLLRAGSRAGAGILVTQTAHDDKLEKNLTSVGCPVVHHNDNNYMWRVIAPEKLGARFAMDPDAATAHAFAMFQDPRSLYWTSDRF